MKRMAALNGILAIALSGCGSQVDTAPSVTQASEEGSRASQQQQDKETVQEQSHPTAYKTMEIKDDGSTVVTYIKTTMLPETKTRTTATGDEETYTSYVKVQEEVTCVVPAGEDVAAFVRKLQAEAAENPQ